MRMPRPRRRPSGNPPIFTRPPRRSAPGLRRPAGSPRGIDGWKEVSDALLEKWTPFRELDLMDRRMRRFFEDVGFVPAMTPAADIYETGDELVVELEVPGFDEKELDDRDHVTTRSRSPASGKEETEKKEKTLRLRERLEKTFARRFELPTDIGQRACPRRVLEGRADGARPEDRAREPHKVEITKA